MPRPDVVQSLTIAALTAATLLAAVVGWRIDSPQLRSYAMIAAFVLGSMALLVHPYERTDLTGSARYFVDSAWRRPAIAGLAAVLYLLWNAAALARHLR